MQIKWGYIAVGGLVLLLFTVFLLQQPPPQQEQPRSLEPKKTVYLTTTPVVTKHPSVSFEGAQISFQSEVTADGRTEKIILKNPTSKEVSGSLLFIVPKEVATDVLELTIDGAAATVLEEDPVLLIPYQLKPNEEKEIEIGIRRSQAKRPQAGIMVVPLPESITDAQALEISKRVRPEGKIFYATQEEALKYSKEASEKISEFLKDGRLTEDELSELEATAKRAEEKGQVVEKKTVEKQVEETIGELEPGITLEDDFDGVSVETISTLLPVAEFYIQFTSPVEVSENSLMASMTGDIEKYAKEKGFVKDSGQTYYRVKLDFSKDMKVVDGELKKTDGVTDFPGAVTGQLELASAFLPKDKIKISLVVLVKNAGLTAEKAQQTEETEESFADEEDEFNDLTVETIKTEKGWLAVNNLRVPYILCGKEIPQQFRLEVPDDQLDGEQQACFERWETERAASSCEELKNEIENIKSDVYDSYSANLIPDIYYDESGLTNYERAYGNNEIQAQSLVTLISYQDEEYKTDWSCLKDQNYDQVEVKGENYAAATVKGEIIGEGNFNPRVSLEAG